jgi:hypothetical protein
MSLTLISTGINTSISYMVKIYISIIRIFFLQYFCLKNWEILFGILKNFIGSHFFLIIYAKIVSYALVL